MPDQRTAAAAIEAMDRLGNLAAVLEASGHQDAEAYDLANRIQYVAEKIGGANRPERVRAVLALVPGGFVIPPPTGQNADGDPYWCLDDGDILTATPEGIDVASGGGGRESIDADAVDLIEQAAVMTLAAIRAHREAKAAAGA